jgi:hypothetical protein
MYLKGLRLHLQIKHKFSISFQKVYVKNPHLLPDVYDPNLYYRACEKNFTTKRRFYMHLCNSHELRKQPREAIPLPGIIIPDIENAKNYCEPCDKALCRKYAYEEHLIRVHKLSIPHPRTILKPHLTPDVNDPKYFSIACEKVCVTESATACI